MVPFGTIFLLYNLSMKFYILFFAFILIWSLIIEPNILTVKSIPNSNPGGITIVFASDFHIKPYEMYRLRKIVHRINMQNPDVVLLGGDFVSGHEKKTSMPIEKIAYELSKIKSKYGVFGVVGNHDGWYGKSEVIEALEKNNIKILLNENVCLNDFCIAGVDDVQTGAPDIEKALSGAKKPVIFLTHSPDIFYKIPDSVGLILAGHLHGGQVRAGDAIIVPSKYGKKFANGFVEEKGKRIYTTRGLGTSILPIRFNCFPEIVKINF